VRPGQIDIEEEEQDAEAEDRWVQLVVISREPIEEKMPVDLSLISALGVLFRSNIEISRWHRTDLGLHEHQIDEQHHKVMLHIFVRKALTSRTLCQSDIRTSGSLGFNLYDFIYIGACSLGVRDGRKVGV